MTVARFSLRVLAPAIVIAAMFTSSASATSFAYTNTVKRIATQDSVATGANTDYVMINGLTSFSTCGTSGGFVILRIRNDAQGRGQLSLLIAALLAGKQVTAQVNDGFKDSFGSCFLQSVTLE